jgi:hypothetical protein
MPSAPPATAAPTCRLLDGQTPRRAFYGGRRMPVHPWRPGHDVKRERVCWLGSYRQWEPSELWPGEASPLLDGQKLFEKVSAQSTAPGGSTAARWVSPGNIAVRASLLGVPNCAGPPCGATNAGNRASSNVTHAGTDTLAVPGAPVCQAGQTGGVSAGSAPNRFILEVTGGPVSELG